MSTPGYLGIDIGGSAAKAGVFDATGSPLSFSRSPLPPCQTSRGLAETPIETIYTTVRDVAVCAARGSGARIRSMAISSQGETFVSLDRQGNPLHPAIMWYDSRAVQQWQYLQEAIGRYSGEEALPVIEQVCSAPKILWLHHNRPDVAQLVDRHLLLPDYLAYRLTGSAITDPQMARTSGFYAEDSPGYSEPVLAMVGAQARQLAGIQPAGSPIGRLLPEVAVEWGLSPETLLVTGTNDQFSGALGAGLSRPGALFESSGTCLALLALTERLASGLPSGLLGGRFPVTKYQYGLAYAKTGGLLLDWFRENFAGTKTNAELDAIASTAPLGAGGLIVLPHLDGIMTPKPKPDARGFFCSLSLSSTLADVYRALLESLSFALREYAELLKRHGFQAQVLRCTGGGAKSDFWSQMKADVTGLVAERPAVAEAATLGAAMLAAFGSGEFASLEEAVAAFYHCGSIFSPDPDRHERYESPYLSYLGFANKLYGID
ncbi:MAG: FGGY family carbohydrate kinase [Chloroflexi bacterium]|nr:FGGY family carbohydrate kinase [Chloroflexota bacterium]